MVTLTNPVVVTAFTAPSSASGSQLTSMLLNSLLVITLTNPTISTTPATQWHQASNFPVFACASTPIGSTSIQVRFDASQKRISCTQQIHTTLPLMYVLLPLPTPMVSALSHLLLWAHASCRCGVWTLGTVCHITACASLANNLCPSQNRLQVQRIKATRTKSRQEEAERHTTLVIKRDKCHAESPGFSWFGAIPEFSPPGFGTLRTGSAGQHCGHWKAAAMRSILFLPISVM